VPNSSSGDATNFRAATLGMLFALGTASCQALPPPARADAREGVVRASSPEEARAVATAFDELAPAVLAEIPDARARRLEVWVQAEPVLYRFPATSAYRDADGFFSETLARIHLRAGADDVRRTLVHELVHASLGQSWRGLPGTVEEGLCDVVAARLCPEGAVRLRAGRLLAAAFALGLDLAPSARPGRLLTELDPIEVFRTHAGLSSSVMRGESKKALYGLAFLVAERIVDRRGMKGFHELVQQIAHTRDGARPTDALLAAAGLSRDPQDWRAAIVEALSPAELAELRSLRPASALPAVEPGPVPTGPASASLASGAAVLTSER
jgi:hypothetical protein